MAQRILIGCLSGWQFPRRRQRCLDSWMAQGDRHRDRLDAVFLFGVPQIPCAERHGRCLFLPCCNAYPFLPQRIALFCRWALEQTWPWEYLFKTDDDVRLDVDRLLDYDAAGADYVGAIWRPGIEYASGGGYFLSRRAAAIVADKLLKWHRPDVYPHPEQPYEDLLVGKALQGNGIKLRIDNERFRLFASTTDAPGPGNDWVYSSPGIREPE